MRTLTRPMFNMGGPIKQGVMHGIREPHKHGGAAAGLVGDQRYPKTGNREHHALPLLATVPWIARAIPAAYRGFKAARTFAPGSIGKWNRFKDIIGMGGTRGIHGWRSTPATMTKGAKFLGRGKKGRADLRKLIKGDKDVWGKHQAITMAEGKPLGFWKAMGDPKRFGMAVREHPLVAASALTLPATGIDLAREHGADVGKGAWNLAKRFGAAVIPGDQSSWYTPKEPPTGVPLNPNLQAEIAAKKELSTEKKKEFALQQREGRVKKYLEMMGYDRSKKTAIADALIDASKIVGDRGSLEAKNITQELINPIIQATSKRLDKPEQIREAVGLMSVKAAIQKDMEDPSIKALRLEQLKELRGGFEKDVGDFILSAKGAKVKPAALERYVRIKANEHGIDFTKVTDEAVTNASGTTEEEKIQNVVGDDGIYMIGDAIIKVTDGIPKHIG